MNAIRKLLQKVKEHDNDLDLARKSGVDQSTIQRFRTGTRGLSFESASKLMDCLGLEVCEKSKP